MSKHYFDPRLKIFALNSNRPLAEKIAAAVGVELGKSSVTQFSDGEIQVNIEESIRGSHVYVIQSTSSPVNDNLMELLIMIDALKRASAKTINVVMPYYGYARQDRKARAREPITAKLVANMIQKAGATRMLTLDLHAVQIQGFFDIPVDHLAAAPLLAAYIQAKNLEDVVVVSPDLGGVTRARALADRLKAPIAIIEKRRPMPGCAKVMNLIGEVKDKNCVIIDDIVDTAGSLCEGAKALVKHGAKSVYACCTHGILSDPAVQRIEDSPMEELIITNTIPLPEEKHSSKIVSVSMAPPIGEVISRIYQKKSVSKLFDAIDIVKGKG